MMALMVIIVLCNVMWSHLVTNGHIGHCWSQINFVHSTRMGSLAEGAQDEVLQLVVVAQGDQLLQAAARDELVHEVAVGLEESRVANRHTFEGFEGYTDVV